METFKTLTRYVVIAFVVLGITITLAGPGADLADNKPVSAEKKSTEKGYVSSDRKQAKLKKNIEL